MEATDSPQPASRNLRSKSLQNDFTRSRRSLLRTDFKAVGFSISSISIVLERLYRRPSHTPRYPVLIFSKARIVVLQSSEMRCFVEKMDFFTWSEILLWSTRTQGTRSCSGSLALESDNERSPHAVPPSLAKVHRFREKADSKKNILRSNSPTKSRSTTENYSGLSFFGPRGASCSFDFEIHLLSAPSACGLPQGHFPGQIHSPLHCSNLIRRPSSNPLSTNYFDWSRP